MKRRLLITAEAQRDLLSIRDHIATDNPGRAETYVDELIARCELIREFPLAARPNLRNRANWRAVPYDAYMIFYSLTDKLVRIRAVKHSATLK